MAQRRYSILILGDPPSRTRKIHLSHRGLQAVLLCGGLALLAIAYVVVQYLTVQVKESELQRLRKTVETQRVVGEKLNVVQEELKQLRAFDHQIRHLAGMEQSEGEDGAAVGGGNLEVGKALREGEEAQRQALLVDRLHQDLQRMEREIALREDSLKTLTTYLTEQKDRLAATPSIWPTRGYVSSRFGPRKSPFTGRRQRHTGIDIAASRGTPIVATADGVVTFSGRLAGYGRAIVITHGFGLKSFYGHNKKNKVKKGDRVKRGQVIGLVGSTGYSTGSHVHYEVLVKDNPVNPLNYIIDDKRRQNAIRGS
ncbi:MAG: M23 family metallopeptidase [Candidatus Methylomirabilales bacterium]